MTDNRGNRYRRYRDEREAMQQTDPEFVRKIDAALAPIEGLIETMWEQLDELKADGA